MNGKYATQLFLVSVLFSAFLALAGCSTSSSSDSGSSSPRTAGSDPSSAALSVPFDELPTDATPTECKNGGVRVFSGIDTDGDGKLESNEYDATVYHDICNGAPGAPGTAGADGTDGGSGVVITLGTGQLFFADIPATDGDPVRGTIVASASNGNDVTFAEATGDDASAAFDVSSTGVITVADATELEIMIGANGEVDPAQFERNFMVTASVGKAPAMTTVSFSVIIRLTAEEEEVADLMPIQDGSETNPYLVDTLAELQSIATIFSSSDGGVIAPVNTAASLAANYLQTADIDASGTASGTWQLDDKDDSDATNDEDGFLPIGNCGDDGICADDSTTATVDETDDNVPFTGSFDGGGYLISGLYINRGTIEGVGLFGLTGSNSVIADVSLSGVDVLGAAYTGALVGSDAGSVWTSFASGQVTGAESTGGLVGSGGTALASSFAAVTTAGASSVGGLVGATAGDVLSGFATGAVSASTASTGTAGGVVGDVLSGGVVANVFAAGAATGPKPGGLAGSNAGALSDSYSLDTAATTLTGGTAALRSYRVIVSTGTEDAAAGELFLATLQGLTCGTALFRWDADGDGTADVACDPLTEGAFPWDFCASTELPVLNDLVGGLDIDGQRLLLKFSDVARTGTGEIASGGNSVDVTLTAPPVGREVGSTLSYRWVLQRSAGISTTSDLDGSSVVIAATAASTAPHYMVHLTIVERDAAGTIIAVYADTFTITVTAA